MAADISKDYTKEQMTDAEKLAKTLAEIPEEKRGIIVMMANSFIDGMEAQEHLTKKVI